MKEKGKYVRKIDRKKLSGASVIALLTFITGAAFFAMGMYMIVYPADRDVVTPAAFGCIALLLSVVGIVTECIGLKKYKRLFLFDKWGIGLNSVMFVVTVGVYVWGLLS